MGRPRKKPAYLIVPTDDLGCVSKDREFDLDSDPDESLLDELQCPHIDDVLIALRKSFSLTYPRNPFIDGLQAALTEIRRIGTEALKPMSEVLTTLHLKPVPLDFNESLVGKVYLIMFSIAKAADLDIRIKYKGKSRRLLDLIENRPGDAVVATLREVVSDTFSEMHGEDEHEATLRRIRRRITEVLPVFNDWLEMIEIEPVAVPTRIENETSDEDTDDGSS